MIPVSRSSFLDDLRSRAAAASAEEDTFRRRIADNMKEMERARVFAYRRLNLMLALSEAMEPVRSEEDAKATGRDLLCVKLGWVDRTDTREAVLSGFTTVAQAVYACIDRGDNSSSSADILSALQRFELWYAENYSGPFWALFDTYSADTPVIDF